jgi:hypothetical protein
MDNGKECWLPPASEGGVLSVMADAAEADMMRSGREVLAHARGILEDSQLSNTELRFIASRLAENLAEVLRVAQSRGIRLGVEGPTPDDDAEEMSDEGLKADE